MAALAECAYRGAMTNALLFHLKRNAIAYLALFVALGGTSYAAAKLPRNSVGSPQIKKNAVTSSKVKNGALTRADFRSGQLPAGPKGDRGDTGAKGDKGDTGAPGQNGVDGAPGSAKAYAIVGPVCAGADGACGGVFRAKGVESVKRTGTGTYCVRVPGADPGSDVAIVSVEFLLTTGPEGNASAMVDHGFPCSGIGGPGFTVRTERTPTGAGTDHSAAPDNTVGFVFAVL